MTTKSKDNLSLVMNIFITITVWIFVFFALYKITNGQNMVMNLLASVMITLIILYFLNSAYKEYSKTQADEPWIIETTKNAQKMTVYSDSNIKLSKDSKYGIEFSYSVWIFINDWNTNSNFITKEQHIFHKGDQTALVSQCPGLWLDSISNEIILKISTFSELDQNNCDPNNLDPKIRELCTVEKCKISNIPINKWFQLTICVINKNVDIYVNGFLKKRCILNQLPKQNHGDIYMNAFNGFNGYMSRFRYFNYSLPIWKIEQVFNQGPSDVPCANTADMPPYLAKDWWMNK